MMRLLPLSARPVRAAVGLACWTLLLLPAAAHAHIRLESAIPAVNDSIDRVPPHLRLRFSAHIELRYTSVSLLAPDGSTAALGGIELVDGADREITLALPPLSLPGTYTVRWRTAGADGHVLEGSYTFVLRADSAAAGTARTDPTPTMPPAVDHAHDGEETRASPLDAPARWLHFTALTLLLGALTFRVALLPRLALSDAMRLELQRGAWRALALAALLLVAAAVLRLWLQSVALHGSDRAFSSPLLSMMLTDTSWGRAWVLQAFLFALVGAAIAWARPPRDRLPLRLAIVACAGLAAIPAMSGHAAGTGRAAYLVVANDALHVAGVGAWIGTLAVLLLGALPAIHRREPDAPRVEAAAVDAFSPLALAAAAVVALTGVINAILHISSPAQLWETVYGRTLVLKVALVAAVVLAGFVNWRIVRPALGTADARHRLRRSATLELSFAAAVLAATAFLTGLARP